MKTTLLWGTAVLALFSLPAAATTVYTCTDSNGRTTYSQQAGKHCKKAEIGKLGTYSNTPAPVVGQSSATASEHTPAAPDARNKKAAQRQLEEAQKALAEGRQIRYGHERNYVRYQERIQQLENAVRQAQEKLDTLNRSGNQPSETAY